MIRLYWALGGLLLFPSCLFAQKTLEERTIEWMPAQEYHYQLDAHRKTTGRHYHFSHARYFDHHTRLPWYYELIPVSRPGGYSVSLENKVFIKLDEGVDLNPSARGMIREEVRVRSQVSLERGRAFVQLQFIPIRRNPVTGNLEGLRRFDLVLEKEGVARKTKQISRRAAQEPSVLRRGFWVKLQVEEQGVYKLSYSKLRDMGFDDPAGVSLYGNASGLLNIGNDTTPDYRLSQIPLQFVKGEDGVFDKGDYLLFYGRNPHQWEYDRARNIFLKARHPYSGYSYYYLSSSGDPPQTIQPLDDPSGNVQEEVTTFPDHIHHEKDRHNLIQSGQKWFGEYFDVRVSRDFDFDIPNLAEGTPVKALVNFVSRSSVTSGFSLYHGSDEVFGVDVSPVDYNFTGYYARMAKGFGSFTSASGQFSLTLQYNKGTPSAEGWLDYITLQAERKLQMVDHQLHFRYRAPETGRIVRMNISNANKGLEVWEVTAGGPARQVKQLNRDQRQVAFKITGDTLFREFIAFYPEDVPAPQVVGEVKNQDLHGMGPQDMMVVVKERFLHQAQRLADIHRQRDDFRVGVTTDQQIYNEFSAGKPDPAAIRNFLRLLYQKSTPRDSLKYLLLFGDGSYDNRNSGSSPFLITYQSMQSLHYSRSFVSDDFFGLLDPGDHVERSPSGLIDLGIGRFPVMDASEAAQLVDKVGRYLDAGNWGPWLNRICFAADDEDSNLHMRDADKLATMVADEYPQFNIQKVYFDAYQQENTAAGARYPGVTKEINEQINNGILLFNYTGHGGEHQLANERILTAEDVDSWSNRDRLPLFMTATCEFTRFDDPNFTSAGEEVFLKPEGGSIASFSTTRLVYASLNYELNRSFYDHVFRRDGQGNPLRLGDVVRLTKNQAGSSNNKRNFSLFGDPALQMPLGKYRIETDSVVPADTLKALDKVTLYGSVRAPGGEIIHDFNGSVNLQVFDKKRQVETLNNDRNGPFTFETRDNILFRGMSQVKGGTFKSEWIVPRDLLPEVDRGKIIYLGHDGKHLAQGAYLEHEVGGYSDNLLKDQQGPSIELYMNDKEFVSGGITNENPTLIAKMTDSSGINTTRTAVGHDISLVLDNDPGKRYILNKYYQASDGAYQEGELRYRLSGLEKGSHQLTLKAWDINNNPSTSSINFTVSESDHLTISKVVNYPNPFTERTAFYFEHNRPGEMLEVMVQILSVSGKLVKSIHTQVHTPGFRAGPIPWNGKDDFGDRIGRGVYLYKLKVRTPSGETAEKIQKLVILK